jgi:glycosyltransferase involved in cell wall biosynthesis
MIFTVITPALNCADFIRANLASVRAQGFGSEDLEHWVIDGGSSDQTVSLLKQETGIRWISERDRGLSDAVNKGIERAQGSWIIWLNADDSLAPDALRAFLKAVEMHPGARIFCGALTYLRYDGSVEQTVPGWDYNLESLLGLRTGINQPATFIHREVFARVGLLDVHNRYAMDYEWVVRAMHHYQCVPLTETLAFCRRRRGSITDANMAKQFREFLKVRRRYHRPYLSKAELRIRLYLWSEWLRRIRWARATVRFGKRLAGREPLHPM